MVGCNPSGVGEAYCMGVICEFELELMFVCFSAALNETASLKTSELLDVVLSVLACQNQRQSCYRTLGANTATSSSECSSLIQVLESSLAPPPAPLPAPPPAPASTSLPNRSATTATLAAA